MTDQLSYQLREELAERLCVLTYGVDAWERILDGTKKHFRVMAEECIRQMEYARRTQGSSQATENIPIDQNEFPGMRGIRILGWLPLKTAPEDWKVGL